MATMVRTWSCRAAICRAFLHKRIGKSHMSHDMICATEMPPGQATQGVSRNLHISTIGLSITDLQALEHMQGFWRGSNTVFISKQNLENLSGSDAGKRF